MLYQRQCTGTPRSPQPEHTHLIVKGSIELWTKPREEDAEVHHPGHRIDVAPRALYEARAGDKGCNFVEGHKVLCPTTRTRIQKNDKKKAESKSFTVRQHRRRAGSTGHVRTIVNARCKCDCECNTFDGYNCGEGETDDDGGSNVGRDVGNC